MNGMVSTGIFTALGFLASLNGCVGECYDCGPCGYIGGPNTADALRVGQYGVDPNNVPTLGLITLRNGECGGDPSTSVWVQYDAGQITTKSPPSDQVLDSSAVIATGPTYIWSSKNVGATTEKITELSMRISFSEMGMMKSVICTSTPGVAATCVDEVP